jgi:hypothetical protein
MTYTPNPTWASDTALASAKFDNLETQYDEAYSYLTSHNHDSSYYTIATMITTFWNAGNDGSGSGLDADLLYYSGGNLHYTDFAGLGVDPGLIIWWYGAIANIPAGWVLCDGNNATPDLRGRFNYGAGGTANPGATGGSATFTVAGTLTVGAHSVTIAEMAAHSHPFDDTYKSNPWGGWSTAYAYGIRGPYTHNGTTSNAGSGAGHGHSAAEGTAVTGNAVASLPHYYALAYIMKT